MTSEREVRGKVWLVGAGPGDPDLITVRGREVLGQAEVVLHDALSHPELLALCSQAEVRNVGKRYGELSPNQDHITSQLIELGRAGKRVVRLKGGDPMLFARGAEEALALAAAKIPFEIVPGISSAIAASEFAGIPLTHREDSSSVTFITGSDQDGKEWSPDAWKKLATATGTICVYMGMRRIEAITQAIIEGGRAPETPAAVIMWGARPEQRTATGTLADIAERARALGLKSPSIIVVGEVVRLRESLNWYESQPLFGRRILIPRPAAQATETVRLVRSFGAIPVVAPAIEILPPREADSLRRAAREASTYDWVVFTSANGVAAFFEAQRAEGLDARSFGSAKLAVIGPKTAQALGSRGLIPDLVASTYVAETLVAELLGKGPLPRRVLLPRADVAREILPETLRAHGVEVDVVSAYLTESVKGDALTRLRAALSGAVDAVLFTSSSMVDAIVDALGADATEVLALRVCVAIGPITLARAEERGVKIDVVAESYTVSGALLALERHFARPVSAD